MLFDVEDAPVAIAQREFPQHFPRDAWVKNDAEDIWHNAERPTWPHAKRSLASGG